MQFYTDGGTGCLVLIIIAIFLMMIFGFITKMIFTTPLGIILLIYLGIRFLMKNKDNNAPNMNEFDNDDDFESSTSYNSTDSSEHLSRVAEDVEYEEVD